MTYLDNKALAIAIVVASIGAMGAGTAYADPQAVKQIEQGNREAMDNYDLLDYEAAKNGLTEAAALAARTGLDDHPVKAQTHLYLGIVEFSGFGDQESAMLQFMQAVEIDGTVEVPAAYRTNELVALLDTARSEVGRSAGHGAGDGGERSSGGGVDCGSLTGMEHTLADTAASGRDRAIEAFLGGDVGAARVTLYYRPEGKDSFAEAEMIKKGECQYAGVIPGTAIRGEFLHYYVAARDEGGKAIASRGSAGSPNIIEVVTGGAAGLGGDGGFDDENPLTGRNRRADSGDDSIDGPSGRGLFVSLAIGSGGGYVTGETESTRDDVGCCFAPALLHVFPEIGYYLSPRMSLSAAFRMGFPIGANIQGHSSGAPSALLRLRYALAAQGDGLTVIGSLGGGIMRNTVELRTPPMGDEEMDTDTVALGPAIAGAGIGYTSPLGGPVLFNFEVNALAGIPVIKEFQGVEPQFGVQFDVNLGLIFAF